MFETNIEAIEQQILQIDPEKYAYTRNYKNGAVTKLSPYISRGVISTKQVFRHLLSLNYPFKKIEKLVQELAWRDYWQQIWIAKGEEINFDLKHQQQDVSNHQIPVSVLTANTNITVIDNGINTLYQSGYIHNHLRMYLASIICNIAKSHWLHPAKWMYSYLLDGDWASNALSWQWVSGSNSNKKYYANQNNINKFFFSDQKETFLDVEYDEFPAMKVPDQLRETVLYKCKTPLPVNPEFKPEPNKTTLIYNYYNLDQEWKKNENVQRVLLLEPSFFEKYPVQENCLNFALDLAKNINGLQLFIGEFRELNNLINSKHIVFKEHPDNKHYIGKEEQRDWMFDVNGYYPSFFSFWKKCKKQIASFI